MMTDVAEIKRILKQLIKDSKTKNQKTIAAAVGITPAYMSQLLDGKRAGRVDMLAKIALEVGTSIGELEQMAAGIQPDPAMIRARVFRLMEQFMDKGKILTMLRKLQQAETAGCLSEIDHFIDFTLEKNSEAGTVSPAANQA
jgi:transcriptional regulator with XRE-family HTH domain